LLGASERDETMRPYLIAGASVTSWATTTRRSYATLDLGDAAPVAPLPPLAVLRVTPDAARALLALEDAFGGPGAPAGVYEAYRDGVAVVIEFDPERSPVNIVVATIDAVLASAPGRTIEPLVPLDDRTLAAFAAFVLGDPALDATRLIETHLDPLLAASRR
jgi:hypothetical protein